MTKIILKIAKRIGVLSESVKLYMYLFTSKRYYALNDRTTNLLMKGDIGMSATTSETAEVITDSDKEDVDLINVEKEVGLFILEKIRHEQADHSFLILILPYLVYLNMAFLNLLVERIINIIVYTLLYNQEGYQLLNYRS